MAGADHFVQYSEAHRQGAIQDPPNVEFPAAAQQGERPLKLNAWKNSKSPLALPLIYLPYGTTRGIISCLLLNVFRPCFSALCTPKNATDLYSPFKLYFTQDACLGVYFGYLYISLMLCNVG